MREDYSKVTVNDLKKLKEIDLKMSSLRTEKRDILNSCTHLDRSVAIEETFGYEYTAVPKCVVCGNYGDSSELSFDQKYKAFHEFHSIGEDECCYTHEQLVEMANKGGHTT